MIISKYSFFNVSTADGARVAAQIVSGIGFLGAGVIFVKDDLIQGLTTAGMWTTSGIAAYRHPCHAPPICDRNHSPLPVE